jgi:XapX domain-containing protein
MTGEYMKIIIGLFLCFVIGAACRFFEVPVPAPPALMGALLVVAISSGYILTDRFLARRPRTRFLGVGPAESCKGDSENKGDDTNG